MIDQIRPSVIFRNFETNIIDSDRTLTTLIPSPDIGSTTMLEKAVLVSLLKLNKSKRIFEFGTFRGETTHLFCENSCPDSEIISIDLPKSVDQINSISDLSNLNLLNDVDNDNFLRKFRVNNMFPEFQAIIKAEKKRVKLLELDSRFIDPKNFYPIDFIFIDGGHSTELIENDTRKSFKMLSNSGIIVWHDYNSEIHMDVTNYLEKFSNEKNFTYSTYWVLCLQYI